jgi:Lon protease-like protein
MKTDLDGIRGGFPRAVPIFPLPGSVLFPGALMPLHIFEPRYRTMVSDAMSEGDGLIAMAMLAQCTQEEYRDRPPFHESVCVGHVLNHETLPGGRSNIVLVGVSIGQAIAREDEAPYRSADITLIPDRDDLGDEHEDLLERAFSGSSPGTGTVQELREHLAGVLPIGDVNSGLIGACAISARIPPLHKLELLQEPTLSRRLERLVEFIDRPWQWN